MRHLAPDALSGSRALWALYKDGTLAGEYKEYRVLALFVHNPGLIHTSAKRVVNLSDLKGLRLRSVPAFIWLTEASPAPSLTSASYTKSWTTTRKQQIGIGKLPTRATRKLNTISG